MVLPRKKMFLRSQAFGESLTTVPDQSVEEPRLNLRLLCSAREGKSVDRLVMMDLNDQNSLLKAPAKKMRIERREGIPKPLNCVPTLLPIFFYKFSLFAGSARAYSRNRSICSHLL